MKATFTNDKTMRICKVRVEVTISLQAFVYLYLCMCICSCNLIFIYIYASKHSSLKLTRPLFTDVCIGRSEQVWMLWISILM